MAVEHTRFRKIKEFDRDGIHWVIKESDIELPVTHEVVPCYLHSLFRGLKRYRVVEYLNGDLRIVRPFDPDYLPDGWTREDADTLVDMVKRDGVYVHDLPVPEPWKELREARTKAEISQNTLARVTGMGIAQISNLESGKRDPLNMTVKNLLALSEALDIDPMALIGDRRK